MVHALEGCKHQHQPSLLDVSLEMCGTLSSRVDVWTKTLFVRSGGIKSKDTRLKEDGVFGIPTVEKNEPQSWRGTRKSNLLRYLRRAMKDVKIWEAAFRSIISSFQL